MKYRIVEDSDKPPIYQAQRWDGFNWLYVHGTTSFSAKETKAALKAAASSEQKIVEELEL